MPEMVYANARGTPFLQLFERLPILEPTYAEWEKNYDVLPVLNWMKGESVLPIVTVTLYVILCFGGRAYLQDKQPYGWRGALAAWNLFLSVFSFCGMARTVPQLLANLFQEGFEYTVCHPAEQQYGSGATGFWVQMFVLSKFPELIDTLFIVARKRPLIFLHWYHHVTVLLFCWHSYTTESSAALYFVAMNYSVHAIMYGYYFLMGVRMKPKWLPPWMITILQISQMFVGVGICIATYLFKKEGVSCDVTDSNMLAGGLMYASYFGLFVKFAVDRFIFGVDVAAKMKGQKPAAKKL